MAKVNRIYGKARSVGNIFEKDGKITAVVQIGAFPKLFFQVDGTDENGNWNLVKSFFDKEGNPQKIKVGKAFKNKEFSYKYTMPLVKSWDKEAGKDTYDTEDAIFMDFVMLKEPQETKGGSKKIGFVKAVIGVAIAEDLAPVSHKEESAGTTPPDIDVDDEEIPF